MTTNEVRAGAADSDEIGGYRAQTLTRGLTVLRTMADVRVPMTLQDLFDQTGIPKPTLVRLLAILTFEGCTVRLDDQPTYSLGPTISAIAAGVSDDLRPEELARPYLQRLAASAGHTANLGVLSRSQVLHLCVVPADRPVRYIVHSGSRDDLHSTGLGKAILSGLNTVAVDKALRGNDFRLKTDHTIVSRKSMLAELKTIRAQGFAHDNQESALGLCCFAVPLMSDDRCIGALSVSGPAAELPVGLADQILPELLSTANRITSDSRLVRALVALSPG